MEEEPIEVLGPLGTEVTVKDVAISSTQSKIAVYKAFICYLKKCVHLHLDADNNSPQEFDKSLNDKIDIIQSFIWEPDVKFLMIKKFLHKGMFLKVK